MIIPRHNSAFGRTYFNKVLLKLSSTLKLRNFENGMKMMAVAPHHWYVQPILAFHISIGVGYCFIHSKGNAKTRVWDRAISSHTFIYIRYSLGIGEQNKLNMKILKSIGMALAAILFCVNFTSCEKEPILSLSVQQITAPSSGNSTSVIVNANNPWTVSGNDWCTVSPSSGDGGEVSVTVTVKENTTYDARNCTLTFTSAGLMASILVNQESNYGIVLPKDTYEISSDAQQISVEVKANVEYDITINAEWIMQSSTRALTSKTYVFNVDANSTYDAREGSITITEKNSGKSEVIKVKQAQKDAIIISSKEYNLSCDAQNVEVKLQTNVDFDILIPDSAKDWVSHISTRALMDKILELDIKANEGYDARACEVILKMKNNILADTIKINQAQKDTLFLNVDTIEVKSKGETINCELNSNIEYICEINEGEDWIKRVSTRGLTEFKETFEILSNEAFSPRTGSIIFKNIEKNIADTLLINQHQIDTVFTDRKDIKATWKGGEYVVTVCSNVQFEIKMPEWVIEKEKTISEEGDLVVTTYTFKVEENLDIEKDDYIIFLWNNEGKDTESKIHIHQECCTIELLEAGTLHTLLTADQINKLRAITISGHINGTDIIIIKRFDKVQYFNIEKVKIVSGGKPYNTAYGDVYTEDNIIGKSMFYGCFNGNDATVILPESVISIGMEAFMGCNIVDLTLPKSLKKTGNSAFAFCRKLTKINFPEGMLEIGHDSFGECPIETITIPSTMTTIGSWAFYGNTALKHLIIKAMPSTLNTIGADAFYGAYEQTVVHIPQGTRDIYYLTDLGRFQNIIEE